MQNSPWSEALADCISPELLLGFEEADMNDLYAWLSQQHHGLRTFQIFQQKLATLSGDEPEQRALCRLLTYLVGSYVEAFDEEPLPVAVADRAFQRLADLVASLDFLASAEHRLADLNRVAACDLALIV